jgi:hypothetical protein
MSADEFSEWMTYSAIEPFGSPVDDLRFGTMVSAWASKVKPDEVFVWVKPEPRGGWQDIKAAFRAVG